jgi:hypothetical protein
MRLPEAENECRLLSSRCWGESERPGIYISCQYLNSWEIKDMERRSKYSGGVPNFTYIAEIFILSSDRISTICGSRISNTKV